MTCSTAQALHKETGWASSSLLPDPYQIEMQRRIEDAYHLSARRTVVPTKLSWQDYADCLWALVELRQYGPERKAVGKRLYNLAQEIRDALDRAGVEQPKDLHIPPKI